MTVTLGNAPSGLGGLGSALPHGSMVFTMSIEDGVLATREHHATLTAQLTLLRENVEPLLAPRGPFSLRLLHDVMLFHDVLLAEEGEMDGVVLASKLTAAGYRVAVRQALGGGSGVQVFSNLRHSFLLVTAPPECTCAGTDFIVEPHFREQFAISHPTPRYAGLLAMMPPVLVGTAEQLTPLVQLLCSEMSLAFEQHGLSLPPWRQSRSLLSKWLPAKVRDYDLSPYASPRASSPETLFALEAYNFGAQVPQLQLGEGALQPISEGASGSITPATFSGDDASPRAVLRDASAALFNEQVAVAAAHAPSAAQRAAGGALQPACAPALVRKSLLSSSIAASNRRTASPEQQRPPVATRAASLPLPAASPVASTHFGVRSGLSYRVASEWQQPAIRTVKMQGQPAKQPK